MSQEPVQNGGSPARAAAMPALEAARPRRSLLRALPLWLGLTAVAAAFGVGFYAYNQAHAASQAHHETSFMARARMLAESARGQEGEEEAVLLPRLAALWRASKPQSEDEYLCIVDADARLLLHTSRPDTVGKLAAENWLLGEHDRVRCRLRDLAATMRPHVGGYISGNGQSQIAAFVPLAERRWLLGVHRSRAAFEAEVMDDLLPLVLAILGVCGLLLPAALLALYGAMRRSDSQVRQLNRSLETRVRSRTAELTAANEEMEFFAESVSHDLRAPLRAIDGFSRALEEELGERLEQSGADLLSRVRTNARQMNALINDMLTLSGAARSSLAIVISDLSQMATCIVRRLRESEPTRRVEVVIQAGVKARCDGPLMGMALENLFANAWHFTAKAKDARIEFGVRDVDGESVYFVADNGAGFDMAVAERLFQPFKRLHEASEYPGTGIGLAIVERVVKRHGGRIWAEAKVGHGAVFSFVLWDAKGAGLDSGHIFVRTGRAGPLA